MEHLSIIGQSRTNIVVCRRQNQFTNYDLVSKQGFLDLVNGQRTLQRLAAAASFSDTVNELF